MSVSKQPVTDKFVRDNATTVDEAESYVFLGLDTAYHPTGGYWFPADSTWDESATGWVASRDEVPVGELIQYPASEREPELVGDGELPAGVPNLLLPDAGGGQDE